MDGEFFGEMVRDIGSGFSKLLKILLLLTITCVGFITFFLVKSCENTSIKETKKKPAITWKLEAKGQKIDTIWIYKFDK
jgi:hypothetical protein